MYYKIIVLKFESITIIYWILYFLKTIFTCFIKEIFFKIDQWTSTKQKNTYFNIIVKVKITLYK